HRFPGQRSNVPQTQHRSPVRNHRHQVSFCRVLVCVLRFLLNFQARHGHSWCVRHAQVSLCAARFRRRYLDLPRTYSRMVGKRLRLLDGHDNSPCDGWPADGMWVRLSAELSRTYPSNPLTEPLSKLPEKQTLNAFPQNPSVLPLLLLRAPTHPLSPSAHSFPSAPGAGVAPEGSTSNHSPVLKYSSTNFAARRPVLPGSHFLPPLLDHTLQLCQWERGVVPIPP